MAEQRRLPDDPAMPPRAKKVKSNLDPKANPYLQHMYSNEYESDGGYQGNGNSKALSKFRRHATTALEAHDAEDGPNNPFNGKPLSQQYFNILKTRRGLPVHKQR